MKYESWTTSPLLDLRILPGGNYMLLRPIRVYNATGARQFSVPEKFDTDIASIPWMFQGVAPKNGPGLRKPAIVHDFLYRTRGFGWSRKDADDLFRGLMKSANANSVRRENRYWMVRAFGGTSYQKIDRRDLGSDDAGSRAGSDRRRSRDTR